ncbi:sodium:calcium antiporter [Halobacillus sp. A5]|uniref:sodium:calcium antiporter n=1 Tax=Halobacillus sp. A5 TaxID=2880263 RepID=UPI0020A63C31|nr:sodium:calcium antiporter [Halobacillus sp. A5]MCP3029317.1 sodium:calcium antiporter [Halobacillus sp. A5]
MGDVLAFVLFFAAAVATFFSASRLTMFGDAVKEKTRVSSGFMGIIIGIAISLPELTSSVTSVVIDAPDLAVGNLIGSNLFNVAGLAIFDLVYRRHQIMTHATAESKLYGWLVIFITLIILLGVSITLPTHIFHISYSTIAVILMYFIGTKWINDRTEYKGRKIKREIKQYKEYSFKQVVTYFALAAAAIMVIGSVLTVTAERIAEITGLGTSFVGSFLVAISTSLPDMVSVGTAMKLRRFNLGVSSLLGSNAFNLVILAITDLIYLRGGLLGEATKSSNLITGGASVVFIFLIIYSISRRKTQPSFSYMLPSILIVAGYFVTTYFVFSMR